jgi:hypothetical protein
MPLSEREKELTARHLLANPHLISEYLAKRKWTEIYALAEYMQDDAPQSLLGTDPTLYRTLRRQITEARLKWNFNLGKLQILLEQI